MSNEEMVAAIQEGNTALLESLWNQMQRMVYTFAYRHYTATQGRGGVTVEDLVQVGYLAMMDAIGRYDPAEAAFSTFLVQYLRKHFQEASGRLYQDKRGVLMPKDTLNVSLSLNITVDDDEETELMEITADPTAGLESAEEAIWREQLRGAVAEVLQELPEEQSAVLRHRFWDQQTYEQIAGNMGSNTSAVIRTEHKALRVLRQPRHRKRLMPFYDFNYHSGTGLGVFRATGMSVQERYLVMEEDARERENRRRQKLEGRHRKEKIQSQVRDAI